MRSMHRFARAVLVATSLLLVQPAAGNAANGEYHVYACNPSISSGAYDSWVPEIQHGGMAAYPKCPARASNWDEGLVTRHAVVPGNEYATVPYLASASWMFRAPPGTMAVGATYEHTLCAGSDFEAGLFNAANSSLHSVTPIGCGSIVPSPFQHRFAPTSALRLTTFCVKSSCNVGRRLQAYGTLRSIDVTLQDTVAPSVVITGGALAENGRWHKDMPSVDLAANDNTSVVGLRAVVDGSTTNGTGRDCAVTVAAPCPNWTGTLPVELYAIGDGRHTLTIEALDLGGSIGSTSREILVDRTPPGRPVDFSIRGGPGWRSANSFSAGWTAPDRKNGAPVKAVRFESCPVNPTAAVRCAGGREPIARSGIDNFRLPGPGEWQVKFWLEDEAGNQDPETAHQVRLAYDGDAPHAAFLNQDSEDPARLRVEVSDRTSQIVAGEIEVRREGEPTWTSLASSLDSGVLTALLDDEALPKGTYALRAHVVDAAGNERSTTQLEGGQTALVSLPLRIPTRLTAGRAKQVKVRHARPGHRQSRTVLIERPRLRAGTSVRLQGRLTTSGANGLADRELEVLQLVDLPGKAWSRIATTRTSRTGRFSFRAPQGPSRTLRFRYPGTSKIRGRTTDVRLLVRSVSTLRVNRRSVVNGEDVTFRGRLRAEPVPVPGKLLQLQAYSRRGWSTFATPRANPSTGRWSYRYRFASTRGRVLYRFRVRIPKEGSYPYETGVSRRVRVLVRGL